MKIKLSKDNKGKRNLITALVLLFVVIGAFGNHDKNQDNENSSEADRSKITETQEETTVSETEKPLKLLQPSQLPPKKL